MNIIQVEDNLKSVPDNRLQQEMSNPSGMFPQYLVMSEISRRAKMRTDYEGRMAANEKTPPRPTMREEMLMSMQSNVPSGGIADLVNSTQQSPNNAMPPIPQEPVRMAAGTTVPFDPYGMFGFTFREDDPETEEDESGYFREKSEVQKALEEYYKSRAKLMPEKLDKQRKLAGGLNLLQAGIAVGTSATPQQIGANLNNLIDGISKSEMQLTKQEDKLAKEQIDGLVAQAGFDKAERDDLAKATELKIKAEDKAASREYMKSLADKTSPIGQVAEEIKSGVFGNPQALGVYGDPIGVDDKGNPIYSDKIDAVKLVNLAKDLQPTVQRGMASDIADILTEDDIDTMAVIAYIGQGLSAEEAQAKVAKQARDKKLELIRQYRASQQINPQTKQTGGVIQSSVQDFNDVIENISA